MAKVLKAQERGRTRYIVTVPGLKGPEAGTLHDEMLALVENIEGAEVVMTRGTRVVATEEEPAE